MGRVYRQSGMVIDPHSAVGVCAARKALAAAPATPVIALGTAHPAKFPDAVEKATGERPALPPRLADLLARTERVDGLANDPAALMAMIDERMAAARPSRSLAKGRV